MNLNQKNEIKKKINFNEEEELKNEKFIFKTKIDISVCLFIKIFFFKIP